MSLLTILSSSEQASFDSPPAFTSEERIIQYTITKTELMFIQSLKTSTNQVGFLLQFGYFKASGKFFTAEKFRQKDISYVANLLNVKLSSLNFGYYQKKTGITHRKKILNMLCWKPLTTSGLRSLNQNIERLVQKQLSPKNIFFNSVNYCWGHKIEIPSTHTLTTFITDTYNQFEVKLLNILQSKITEEQQRSLTIFSEGAPNTTLQALSRPPITLLKKINQSLRPGDIQDNVKTFIIFKDYFLEFKSLIDELDLSEQATHYMATWVKKAKTFQINQFSNKMKSYLYLICYIKNQYYLRHDILIDIFLKSVHSANNAAIKKELEFNQLQKPAQQKAFKAVSQIGKNTRTLIDEMRITVKSPTLIESEKLTSIEKLIDEYDLQNDKKTIENVIKLEKVLESTCDNQVYFNALEALSLKLQHRVTLLVTALVFNSETSDKNLMKAIDHFKIKEPEIGNKPPTLFLTPDEKSIIYNKEKLRTSLYKILLFSHMKEAIKAGKLNLHYSYRYKSIKDYLIDDHTWENNKDDLLEEANLSHMANLDSFLEKLASQLDKKYKTANQNYLQSNNPYLTISADNHIKIKTPKLDENDNGYIASLLMPQGGCVPILRVLNEISQLTSFTSDFKHFSIKHKKMKPLPEAILACLIGQGCNIGVNRLANVSVGVSDDSLKNTINWFFTLENIQAENNSIIGLIDKLVLANAFRAVTGELHTSSDGRKINVAVDSLHASFSFKYYGKGKGVTLYTFLDERQALFYSTVITSSDRDAPYVIDGLLNNEIIKSSIHSTDTHGFTEAVFAVANFIEVAFAPRIKKIGKQKLYTLGPINDYKKNGYKILPSRTIKQQLIRDHWDDLLRFMVTIKLKHTSASQLFKRLSSYAKDHPLYQALKEFGRIIKSIFILTYLDDMELRQRTQKQLNKVELSNKFSKAVFFANNQEFTYGTHDEQEIAAACSVLIQNAIVLWNYLTVSQCLAEIKDLMERNKMVTLIKQGSMMTWGHLNMGGEYDFTLSSNEDNPFDMEKILELKLQAA